MDDGSRNKAMCRLPGNGCSPDQCDKFVRRELQQGQTAPRARYWSMLLDGTDGMLEIPSARPALPLLQRKQIQKKHQQTIFTIDHVHVHCARVARANRAETCLSGGTLRRTAPRRFFTDGIPASTRARNQPLVMAGWRLFARKMLCHAWWFC